LVATALDIFATIATQANAPLNPDRRWMASTSHPTSPARKSTAPHDAIYLRNFDQEAFAVRSGDHKFVQQNSSSQAKLFNLAKDIGETKKPGRRAGHPRRSGKTPRCQGRAIDSAGF